VSGLMSRDAEEEDGQLVVLSGLDDAVIGIGHVNGSAVVVYDKCVCLRILEEDGTELGDGETGEEFLHGQLAELELGDSEPIFVDTQEYVRLRAYSREN